MTDPDAIAALLNYDHWCTVRLAASMETLAPADLQREFPTGWRTLHATLYHIVSVAETWADRSRPDPTGVRATAYPGPDAITVATLRERYRVAGRQMVDNLAALCAIPQESRDVGWLIRHNHLIHVTTHAMHHRAQMISMLTQLGVKDVIEGGDFGGWANGPLKASVSRDAIARYLY